MAAAGESDLYSRRYLLPGVELNRLYKPADLARVFRGEQRRRRMVLGVTFLVGVVSIFLFDARGIGQEDACQVARRFRGENLSTKSMLVEKRKIAAMVEMGMGQDHGLNRGGIHRKRCPVLESEFFQTLEKTAIYEKAFPVGFHEMPRPCYSARS